MKKILPIILFLISSSIAFAQKAKNDTIVIQTKIYCAHCAACSSCQPHIEHELRFEKGVKLSWVDAKKQTITVIDNPVKTNPKTIKEAIANSGFDADDVLANPKAVAKLDGCCRK
jgi:hypothetical protein